MGQFTDTFLYRDLYFMIKQTYILPGTAFTLAAISSLPEYPRPSLEEPSCYLPESEVMCRGEASQSWNKQATCQVYKDSLPTQNLPVWVGYPHELQQ